MGDVSQPGGKESCLDVLHLDVAEGRGPLGDREVGPGDGGGGGRGRAARAPAAPGGELRGQVLGADLARVIAHIFDWRCRAGLQSCHGEHSFVETIRGRVLAMQPVERNRGQRQEDDSPVEREPQVQVVVVEQEGRVVHADASGVYGLLGDAGVFASAVTRLFHSAGVIDRSWGSSAAAITSLRKLVSTTNSSAAFGLAASSSLANCA